MSDHYSEAPRSLRWSRLISKNREMLREIPDGGLESFESQLDDHLTGRWVRNEVQAGAVRLYLMYREVESLLDRSGDLPSFSRAVCEQPFMVFNYLRGGSGKSRYTSDQLHGWCCLLTKRWLSDGFQVHVILHPNGSIEPVVSEFKAGTPNNGGSK